MIRVRRTTGPALLLATLLTAAGSSGCSGIHRGPAVPRDLQDQAAVAGMPTIRTWGDYVTPQFQQTVARSLERRQLRWAASSAMPPAGAVLAISGGGANGAFGAGLLCGWTARGDRPEFEIVTGISTGALIAPFAFLGPEYDPILKEVYTTISTSSILKKRWILSGILSDALADNQPLWKLMRRHVNQELLNAIAAEYEKGRMLLIGTVNLDARRPVVWDIGAIAASNRPEALQLIQSVLIASAAIPAAFPPVMIDVEANGRPYQEMHVDGGCLHEVFLYPTSFTPLENAAEISRDRRVYIIRNSRVDPDWAAVERRTLSIAGRAIAALIHSQGLGDLDRMFMTARRDGMDFNLAHIPAEFQDVPKEPFDREYMQKLFDLGYKMAESGYPWAKVPPGYLDAKHAEPRATGTQ